MSKLSVIVPVYNVEAYLAVCIESILHQTLEDLELILIDDGSPDRCGDICDEYASRDCRVKVIHQNNQGVSAARNAGLEIARGDYFGFVDPDDFVAADMYEKMINEATKQSADLAICGFTFCKEDCTLLNMSAVPEGVYEKEDLITSMYGMPNVFHGSMCNKIFAKKIMQGLKFDTAVAIGEDWLLLYECYEKSDSAVSLSDCFYTVRVRDNSATRKYTADVYLRKLETYLRIYEYSKKQSKMIQKKAVDKILDACQMNKNAIIEQDYDKYSISIINRQFRRISIREFFQGNLTFKRAVYHFIKGLQY